MKEVSRLSDFMLAVVSCCGLLAAGSGGVGMVQADYFPPGDPKAGGIRDLMLIYLDRHPQGPKDFLPYVAYLGTEPVKQPRDWFYDSFLFLAYGGAPSGTTYIDGATNKADWEYYMDQLLFRPGSSLAALDACIGDVEKALGSRPALPVILMIPYPAPSQKAFGDVDGDGASEDFAQPAGRETAVRWCVDELLRRWQSTRFAHLRLWGFYWMNEGIGPQDEALVRATADLVHRRGYGLHWIPYYRAPGYDKTAELGIDFAVLQPNYAFMEQNGRRPEEQRLCDTAAAARRHRLGIEIEMAEIAGRGERDNLWDYLAHGREACDGYMRQAVHAYYQGQSTIAKLCYSDQPAGRALYEALYQFAKGTFSGQREHLSTGCRYRIDGETVPAYPDDGRKLTDNLSANDPGVATRLAGLSGDPVRMELDLGESRRIAGVTLRIVTRGKSGEGLPENAACPRYYDVAVSATGRDWLPVGRGYRWYATPGERITAGDMVAEFGAVDARFVAVTVHPAVGTITLVDELRVEPAASLTGSALCRPSPASPEGAALSQEGGRMFDTRYQREGSHPDQSCQWAVGQPGTMEIELPQPFHLGLLRLHSPQAACIQGVEVLARAVSSEEVGAEPWKRLGQATRSGNGWDFDAGAEFSAGLRLVALPLPGQAVGIDEIEVYPADNLALGKPYELRPAHPGKYGDPELRKLTDGAISERGFGDGRMVGWYGQNVEVSLDLGERRVIDAVRLHTEGGGNAAVEFSPRLDVLVSTDGRDWTWAGATDRPPGTFQIDRVVGRERKQAGWMEVPLEAVEARFVMFQLAPKAWTMVSEIEVAAAGRNVAQGKSYHLRPAPASSAPYADSTGKLTDGRYTSSGFSRSVGWQTDRPQVVVDLGRAVSVSEVTAHVVGGGPGGVYFPAKVSVTTSVDGVRWEGNDATTARPPESGRDAGQASMRVQFRPRPGRYVRLEFERRGWLMLDEIEVYGPPESQ